MASEISYGFALWLGMCVASWILCILQLYGLYQFISMRNLLIIRKRYPTIIVSEAIVAVLMTAIANPIWGGTLFNATNFGLHSMSTHTLQIIGWMCLTPTSHFIVNMEACRIWLIQFNLHYLRASNDAKCKWKSQIDSQFGKQQNWYLTNKDKYGNRNFVVRLGFVYYLCSVCILYMVYIFLIPKNLAFYAEMVDSALYTPAILLIIYTCYKCPKYSELSENFMFYYELRLSTFFFSTGFIWYFVSQITLFLGYEQIHDMFLILITFWGLAIPSLISTVWIPRRILSMEEWRTKQSVSKSPIAVMMTQSQQITEAENRKLREVLLDEEQFEALVDWMYREFSFENILCFIELVQFKQRVTEPTTDCLFALYENVPKSSIVYDVSETRVTVTAVLDVVIVDVATNIESPNERLKQIAHKLYEKYIRVGAEFEVNISWDMRKKYASLDRRNWTLDDEQEIAIVFDEVIDEMFEFLKQSYFRFERSP